MKISVNDIELFSLSEVQKSVIANDINLDELDIDLKRRLQWVLTSKYDECYRRLFENWYPILSTRVQSIPTDKDEFAQLVFSQSDYTDKKTRDLEAEATRQALLGE